MQYSEELEDKVKYINNVIERFLPEEKGPQKTVIEALNYSILAGGKRIRPLLMLEMYGIVCRATGREKREDELEPFMASLEMIHTYSLVHDDLPEMDNDDLRRGKPTTHKKYGQAMGVLAGDALLNYSVETATRALQLKDPADDWYKRVLTAITVLYKKAGIYGMIGGQTVDVEKNGMMVSDEELVFVYRNKTCELISAALVTGAVIAGGTGEMIEDADRIGEYTGLAFQITDDILDVISDEKTLGKPIGSDEKNGKTTYVSVHGIAKAKEKAAEYTEKALEIIDKYKGSGFLRKTVENLLDRKY